MTSAPADGARVIVWDARRLVRERIGAYLADQPGIASVVLVADGDEIVRAVRGGADVLLVDVRHAGRTPVSEVLEALRNLGNPPPALLLGLPPELGDIVRAVVSGPVAILPADIRPPRLLATIQEIAGTPPTVSDTVIAPFLAQASEEHRQREENARTLDSLTERERTVLQLLSMGLRRGEIAEKLGLSPNTVRTHLAHVMQKLNTHTQVAAAMRGRELFGDEPPAVIDLQQDTAFAGTR